MTRVEPSIPRFGTIEPVSGSGLPAQAGDRGCGEDAGERLQRPPCPPARGLHREREECDRADGREQRARDEEEAGPCVAPAHREPGDARGPRTSRAAASATFPSGNTGTKSAIARPEARRPERRAAGGKGEQEHEARRPERAAVRRRT